MSATAFDAVVKRLDDPLIVVTTASDDERAGCLVGFHTQCSIEPLRYAIWLSKANVTYRVGLFASHLAVHFLIAPTTTWPSCSEDRAVTTWTSSPSASGRRDRRGCHC